MDLLTAQLDEYNKHGVPKLADLQLQHGDLAINDEGTKLSSPLPSREAMATLVENPIESSSP